MDHRAVAQAYRTLSEEGLVEVRGRSGVCIASSPALPGGSDDWTEWVARVMADGWQRSLSYPSLATLFALCTRTADLRCLCVESNQDQMLAYQAEIGAATGMSLVPVYLDPSDREEVQDAGRGEELRQALATADLLVTTQYHAAAVRSVMGSRRVPLVTLCVNPELAETVRQRIRGQGLTVVAATAAFGERLRLMYSDIIRDPRQLQVILATDAETVARIPADEPILITRAARELLPSLDHLTLVFPHSPTIAPGTIVQLSEVVARVNLSSPPRQG